MKPGGTPTPTPPVTPASPVPPSPSPSPPPVTFEATPGGTPSAYLTYKDQANGIIVDYPRDWSRADELLTKVMDAVGIVAFRSPTEENSFRPFMIVTKRVLPISLSVREVFDYAHSTGHQAAEFPGYVSISDQDITLGSLSAIKHVFTYSEGGLKVKVKQLWVVKDTQAWVVRCVTAEASFDSWQPTLDTIVLSLTFL